MREEGGVPKNIVEWPPKIKKITPVLVLQKVRVFGLKTLFLKRFTVRSTTRTLITDKNGDHSAFTAILVCLGDFGQIPGPSSVLFWRVLLRVRGAFLCIRRLAGGAGAAALASLALLPVKRRIKFCTVDLRRTELGTLRTCARVPRARARAPRAPTKIHQPSNDIKYTARVAATCTVRGRGRYYA